METSASEPLKTYRNLSMGDVKTGDVMSSRDQAEGNLFTDQSASGIKAA
jgi:hypothetical protein